MFTSYTVALFCHVLGVLLFVSGIVLAGAPFEIARRRDSPAEIAAILGIARVGAMLAGIGAILVFGFGLWLVHLGGFALSTGWVQAALGLFILALALGAWVASAPSGPDCTPRSSRRTARRSTRNCAACSMTASRAPPTTRRRSSSSSSSH